MTSPQESSERLMYHIGRAMSLWQGVEGELCHIFQLLLQPHTTANAVFNAVATLNTKIGMVDAALYTRITDADTLEGWKRLKKKVDTGRRKRNTLAHHEVILDSRDGEAYLLPNAMDVEDFVASIQGRGSRYNWKDIEKFEESFNELRHELSDFHFSILRLLSGETDQSAR